MDLIDKLREISARIPKLRQDGLIKTEEGTKNALIMPFITALGYNVFDPTEVTPELIADVGTKKGEKVDYAILRDGKPIMLFECKSFGTDLENVHASQLYRYFSVTEARFGVLTDGVQYRFYSDLEKRNLMDNSPFYVFDLTEVKESAVEELKKFTKAIFNEDAIITTASELKYKGLIRQYLYTQLQQPSDDLVRLLGQASGAYTGRFTQTVIDDFRVIVRDSLKLFISEQVDNRLKTALASDSEKKDDVKKVEPTPAPTASIVTTQEEIEAWYIIRSILRERVDAKRITMRDVQSYCSILLDDNNRRPIARLYFAPNRKQIGIFDQQKVEERHSVETIDDIFNFAEKLNEAVSRYLGEDSEPPA